MCTKSARPPPQQQRQRPPPSPIPWQATRSHAPHFRGRRAPRVPRRGERQLPDPNHQIRRRQVRRRQVRRRQVRQRQVRRDSLPLRVRCPCAPGRRRPRARTHHHSPTDPRPPSRRTPPIRATPRRSRWPRHLNNRGIVPLPGAVRPPGRGCGCLIPPPASHRHPRPPAPRAETSAGRTSASRARCSPHSRPPPDRAPTAPRRRHAHPGGAWGSGSPG